MSLKSLCEHQVDAGIYLRAGPEIGVASTKAFTAQVFLRLRRKTIFLLFSCFGQLTMLLYTCDVWELLTQLHLFVFLQVFSLVLFAVKLGVERKTITEDRATEILRNLREIPGQIQCVVCPVPLLAVFCISS